MVDGTKYIDAYAFRRNLDKVPPFTKAEQDENWYYNFAKSMIVAALDEEPAGDVRPVVRGRWDNASRISRKGFEWFKCSNCGMEWSNLTNFCPNCGADMREEAKQDG